VTLELAESLLLEETVSPRALARGLFLEVTQQMPLVQALLATGSADEAKIAAGIARPGEPEPLETLTASLSLVQRLPRGLCARLLAVPLGVDPQTGVVDLAVLDPRDEHAAREVAFFLHAPVQMHRATVAALRAAVEQLHAAEPSLSEAVQAPERERSRTPIWGTPVVSVVPQAAPHAADMAIPLMRRSSAQPPPPRNDDSAVLELRTPASSARGRREPAPDTERDPEPARATDEPIFNLKAPSPASLRRPVGIMISETPMTRHEAVTIPAPKQDAAVQASATADPNVTQRIDERVTAPAPARRSEPPPRIYPEEPARARRSSLPRSETRRPSATGLSIPHLPFPDAGPVLAAMEEANDRDAIIALLVSGMRAVARRVAILAVKRDEFVGWSCNAEFGDARAWRGVHVPMGVPSVLATAAAGTPYLGPLFRTDGHLPILEFMGEASRDVAVTGVRVDMHPALVLVADELGDTALGTKRMEQLAKAAGVALARVLRKK
jgi:hypothetical protein